MKFKSPAVERLMTHLSQSIAAGILVPSFLLFVIMLTDTGDSERPLLETHPFAYVLAWPLLLWKHLLPDFMAVMATAATNFFIYYLLTYWLVGRDARRKRLP